LKKLEINSIYNGIIVSINKAFVTVDLGGAIGKLPSTQPAPDQNKFVDLSTLLHIGQEIEVSFQRKKKMLFFFL
jgi:ribosomal protein S1